MKQALAAIATASIIALATPGSAQQDLGFKIVVAADHATDSVTQSGLAKVFLGKVTRWDDGTAALPVDQTFDSPIRRAFTNTVHGKSVTTIRSYWQRVLFSGNGTPPPEATSDSEVLQHIEKQAGAVGYVAASTPLTASFRVLEVSDLEGYDVAALSQAGGGVAAADFVDSGDPADPDELDDELVSTHGDVRLFLTGWCGAEGEGREALLENGNTYDPLQAQVEVSLWDSGWFRSSSVVSHTIDPLSEKRLGCTRGSGNRETRFSIVHVSSAASHSVVPDGYNGPPRSAVDIVGSGTCGRGRKGSWRSVVNKHPYETVAVSIRYLERQDGNVRRRYEKSHSLAPGATRRLGCSLDGSLARQFTVLEARYR